MKDKKLCRKCKYHGTFGNRTGGDCCIVCDYAATAQDGTALRRTAGGEAIDRRGNNYHECLLFQKGKAIGRAQNSKDYQGTILNRGESK